MQQTISSILQAEAKAEQIKTEAEKQSALLLAECDQKVEDIKNGAIDVVKAYRKSERAKAEKAADDAYDKIVSDGEVKAKEIATSACAKLDSAACEIVKEILE